MSYIFPQACVAMFAKEPVAGKVKTRLIPALGAQGARNLHVQLLQRQIDVLERSRVCVSQLWVDNNPEHQAFIGFRGKHRIQVGGNLGEKMSNAIVRLLEEFEYALVIGSDCPQLDEMYLKQAIEALKQGAEVVLGPAADGGYVLIGMKKAMSEVFQGISWGSANVLQQTRERLRTNNVKWFELSELFDIDIPEDLGKLV